METKYVASSCSTAANTTESLLNRLINIVGEKFAADEGKTDWDPITFAFTVPFGVFGILATLFALVAIIQGIFAASPGRRKSSRQVIGDWATRTRSHISLWELRTYTQATTPHFTADDLLSKLPNEEQANTDTSGLMIGSGPSDDGSRAAEDDDDTSSSVSRLTKLLRRLGLYPGNVTTASASSLLNPRPFSAEANWLRLLSQFGIADLLFDEATSADTAADFIPDDLRAVPAYADIHAIVTLAAFGGAESFEPEIGSSYPFLIAPQFQIEFRQHPVLGRVAAFSGTGLRTPPESVKLIEALKHWFGRIELKENLVRESNSSHQDIRVFDLDIVVAEHINLHGRSTQRQNCHENSICRYVFHDYSIETGSHILWLLAAKCPAQAPVLFPRRFISIHNETTLLCLQSKFWTLDKTAQDTGHFISVLKRLFNLTEWEQSETNINDAVKELRTTLTVSEYGTWKKGIIGVCKDFIHGDDKITPLSREQRAFVVRMLRVFDKDLDAILDAVRNSASARPDCQSTVLYVTTLMLFAYQKKYETALQAEINPDWREIKFQPHTTSLVRNNLPLLSSLDRFLGKNFPTSSPWRDQKSACAAPGIG